jgi:hypothetical protein
MTNESERQRTEDRREMTEDRGQRTEDSKSKIVDQTLVIRCQQFPEANQTFEILAEC